jgi:hypothetical protein
VPDRQEVSLGIHIPSPPCWWPWSQVAEISIRGTVADNAPREVTLFNNKVALIYPGCALVAWYLRQRRVTKDGNITKGGNQPSRPLSFWASLDPVELTKNAYGQGSLGKLQIFLFSFIVFGLLLLNVLRCGLLAGLSTHVLYLLGISAGGAVGGKIAFLYRRRLSLENWAWLRRMTWLLDTPEAERRARWSDLLLDTGTGEFDPYNFQMAIFSIVVVAALINTSIGGLETFSIPPTLLGILGISQVVYVGGKAIQVDSYKDLNAKLDDIRKLENECRAAQAGVIGDATAAPDPAKIAKIKLKHEELETALKDAAEMFLGTYEQPPDLIRTRDDLVKLASSGLPNPPPSVGV